MSHSTKKPQEHPGRGPQEPPGGLQPPGEPSSNGVQREFSLSKVEGEPPLSRAQLEQLYLHQPLSLQQIAERASEQLGRAVSRSKVREWLLWHRIPRRSFAEAAHVKFGKRHEKKAAADLETEKPFRDFAQPSLFEEHAANSYPALSLSG